MRIKTKGTKGVSEQPPPTGTGKNRTVPLKRDGEQKAEAAGFIRKNNPTENNADSDAPILESELAAALIGELYPLLLENCTDEDDEVDTRAVFESLAGLLGVFTADYREAYGEEKAMAVFQDLVTLALSIYQERANT